MSVIKLIRQHGENGEHYDMSSFFEDFDRYFHVKRWQIQVDWCQGDGSSEIERQSENGLSIMDTEFRELYRNIYQTIDGEFQAFDGERRVARLLAIDSSYWEVESDNQAFIDEMAAKCGLYQSPLLDSRKD